jgi:hypothetical protein
MALCCLLSLRQAIIVDQDFSRLISYTHVTFQLMLAPVPFSYYYMSIHH